MRPGFPYPNPRSFWSVDRIGPAYACATLCVKGHDVYGTPRPSQMSRIKNLLFRTCKVLDHTVTSLLFRITTPFNEHLPWYPNSALRDDARDGSRRFATAPRTWSTDIRERSYRECVVICCSKGPRESRQNRQDPSPKLGFVAAATRQRELAVPRETR